VSGDALERPGGAPGQRGALTRSLKLIPKNMLLPAGLRQRDQTKKSPTGPLDREALLQYLEQQALEVKERDDLVPFTGEKKGMGSLTSMPPRTQWWSLTCPRSSFLLTCPLLTARKSAAYTCMPTYTPALRSDQGDPGVLSL